MSDDIVEAAFTIKWAEQGGLSLMQGERLIKAADTEEAMALFFGGYLKAIRDPSKSNHITIPREDYVRLLDDQKKLRSVSSTQRMAQRLSPTPADENVTTFSLPDDGDTKKKWVLGFGGRR